MSLNQSQIKIKLLESVRTRFERVEDLIGQASASLDESQRIWVPDNHVTTKLDPLIHIRESIKDIWHYNTEGDARVTRGYYGLVTVTAENLLIFRELNRAKSLLKSACKSLRDGYSQSSNGVMGSRSTGLRRSDNLTTIGLGRLHLAQAYRQFPILTRQPLKVSFSWHQHGRSLEKVRLEQAIQELQCLIDSDVSANKDVSSLQIQMNTLNSLEQFTVLVRAQRLAPALKMYASFGPHDSCTRRVSLPVIVPAATTLMKIKDIPEMKQGGRSDRSDLQICREPLVPILRLHAYISR